MIARVLVLFSSVLLVSGLYEGDDCETNGAIGTCVNLNKCRSALADIKRRINPQICTFEGVESIVCCLDKPHMAPMATTTRPVSTTTEYIPTEADYIKISGNRFGEQCEPIPTAMTAPRTGQKAWDKCIDYQEKYVYPCEPSVALSGGMTRVNNCHHKGDGLIIGGVSAALYEFPHMAMIGFGERSDLNWLCGGSIISENFILTAGHCISDRTVGNATHVVIGVLTRSDADTAGDSKIYRIKRVVRHPNYKPPVKYNDIVLMETDRPMKLDQYTVPACLDVGNANNYDKAYATGWGLTINRGNVLSEKLQKVTLTKFTNEECSLKYPANRHMKNGLDSTQLCYGDKTQSKDTCQGDSGGPLQIQSRPLSCMYVIVGVTSFGKACGFVGDPGVYTRVASYVPWIESVVWP